MTDRTFWHFSSSKRMFYWIKGDCKSMILALKGELNFIHFIQHHLDFLFYNILIISQFISILKAFFKFIFMFFLFLFFVNALFFLNWQSLFIFFPTSKSIKSTFNWINNMCLYLSWWNKGAPPTSILHLAIKFVYVFFLVGIKVIRIEMCDLW